MRRRRTYLIASAAPAGERAEPLVLEPSGTLSADASRCSGCRTCEMVCSLHHEGRVAPALARLRVRHDAFADDHPAIDLCAQCPGPECLLACPRSAIGVHPQTGARVVDPALCNGCGLCVAACHLGMIAVDPADKLARTCDLCEGDPQCVAFCPQQVLSYRPRTLP